MTDTVRSVLAEIWGLEHGHVCDSALLEKLIDRYEVGSLPTGRGAGQVRTSEMQKAPVHVRS